MNVQTLIQRSIKRLRDSPEQVLEKARRGSIPDLKDLANLWQEVPDLRLVSLGILEVFFLHLSADTAFADPSEANERTPTAERAFYALFGLSKSGDCFLPGTPHHRNPAVLKAWPGIFKWSAFFYKTRVTSLPPRPAEGRRSAMDIISRVWYCFTRAEGLREAIAATKGTIEIATHLWLLDDDVPQSSPNIVAIPCAAAALDAILTASSKIAMSRTRTALSRRTLVPVEITIYLDLLGHLSYGRNHPLRIGLLHAGAIPLCTRAAGDLARALGSGGDVALLDGIVAAFGYLVNCLQSTEGFTWVVQSLTADLLLALADASPHFSRLDAEDYDMVSSLLKEMLPTYLVYRSVIQAVDEGMRRLGAKQQKKIDASIFRDVWIDFQKLALERHFVVMQAVAVKGRAATCDNVECHKVDAKNTFRKCGGCSTTLYCSKECQTLAWKQGGHKTMCKMKQRERLEGKSQAISKSDAAFFHHLSIRDARHHLPFLRRLARSTYPALRSCELLIRIDYTAVPPAYSVVPLAEAERHDIATNGSANAEARNDALLERARANPDRFGLIQSQVANGAGMQLVLSVVTGNFWDKGDDSMRDTGVDDVDLMMARTVLNQFLAHKGEPPAF
ncbi:hypothetical protein B0H14DRAFT_2741409 [Mycena olivaceomarginata]|nr:hypothetical protein B0H14DRAFT_2741409 [Mycena olivaceomarginata]